MGVDFVLHKGTKFKDDRENIVTFLEYDELSNCMFFELDVSGIQFSQPMPEFLHQYCMGIIMEVHSGPVAKDLV